MAKNPRMSFRPRGQVSGETNRAKHKTEGNSGSERFSIIYADPPWKFRSWSPYSTMADRDRKSGRLTPYPCLSTDQIGSLPIARLCAPDCVLFLWATYPMLPAALMVIRAWGFTYKTVAFTWAKLNPSGNGFATGMGYWTRSNPEICLLATRGHPRRTSRSVPNLVIARRREHSRKPDEVRERIVRLCGNVPRIELFAREATIGWRVWGNEVVSDVKL